MMVTLAFNELMKSKENNFAVINNTSLNNESNKTLLVVYSLRLIEDHKRHRLSQGDLNRKPLTYNAIKALGIMHLVRTQHFPKN